MKTVLDKLSFGSILIAVGSVIYLLFFFKSESCFEPMAVHTVSFLCLVATVLAWVNIRKKKNIKIGLIFGAFCLSMMTLIMILISIHQ